MASPDTSRPAAPSPPPSRGRRLLALCVWGYLAAALALWLVLHWADLWWPANLLLFAPRWLYMLPLLLLVPAAGLWRRRLLAPLVLAAVVAAGPVSGLCVPWRVLLSPAPAGPRLRVLTCNLHYSKALDPPGLEALVEQSGADVVALQEWQMAEHASLAAGPGWHRHATPRLFLASRFPIRRVISLGNNSVSPTGSLTRYDLETPAGLVHFFSLHLASPREGIYETIHENPTGPADVSDNLTRRWQQSQYVAVLVEGLDGPVVLAGDFNTPPESALFGRVWGDYSDAFATAGWGWGYTFTGARTTVRIDHILMGKGWHCTDCWVGPKVGSPHRPVLADLVWTGAAEQ